MGRFSYVGMVVQWCLCLETEKRQKINSLTNCNSIQQRAVRKSEARDDERRLEVGR